MKERTDVGTWDLGSTFPNLANKGVGFTPKDEFMDHYVNLVEGTVAEIEQLPPHAADDTRRLRIATAREFYAHPEHIDWRRLGLLEIFEGSTYRNLSQNPMVQTMFPYSYTFWVYDWKEKTPKRRYT